jgi:hypothetical protein
MIIDCMTCPVRNQRCDDCALTVLLAPGSAEQLQSTDSQSPTTPRRSTTSQRTSEPARSPDHQWSTSLALDAAENDVVSILVGAGLVSAEEVPRLRARRVPVPGWGTVRDAG